MRIPIYVVAVVVLVASGAHAKTFIYPEKGQDAAQQSKDDAECRVWARDNSGVDPNAPAAAADRGGRAAGAVGGAARGAAVGAAIGAIAGDAGKGAAIGAVGGGVRGRRGAVAGERAGAAARSLRALRRWWPDSTTIRRSPSRWNGRPRARWSSTCRGLRIHGRARWRTSIRSGSRSSI